jgi:hypothetical protein
MSNSTKWSDDLEALVDAADASYGASYGTYQRKDFAAAAKACLKASLAANKEGFTDVANAYGRKYAEANKKALGG